MYNIKKHPGQLINLLFNSLKRKPVTNQEARNNFSSQVLTYYAFINRVSNLEIKNNDLFASQISYFSYLDTMVQRFMSIGDEAIPDSKLDLFLNKLQKNMLEFCEIQDELNNQLFEIEKEHYSNLAYQREYSNHTAYDRRTEELKSDAVEVLKYGKNNKYVTFENE